MRDQQLMANAIIPSVTEFTTRESRPDLGTMAFPLLDRLPSAHKGKTKCYRVRQETDPQHIDPYKVIILLS